MGRYIYLSILDDANGFKQSALKMDIGKELNYIIPFIVNSTLSIELYLKSILMANKIKYDGIHSLVELYKLLPSDDQKSLKDFESSFFDLLNKYDDAFIKYRYHFELYNVRTKKENEALLSYDENELILLLNVLSKYCNEKYRGVDFVQLQLEANKEVDSNE